MIMTISYVHYIFSVHPLTGLSNIYKLRFANEDSMFRMNQAFTIHASLTNFIVFPMLFLRQHNNHVCLTKTLITFLSAYIRTSNLAYPLFPLLSDSMHRPLFLPSSASCIFYRPPFLCLFSHSLLFALSHVLH